MICNLTRGSHLCTTPVPRLYTEPLKQGLSASHDHSSECNPLTYNDWLLWSKERWSDFDYLSYWKAQQGYWIAFSIQSHCLLCDSTVLLSFLFVIGWFYYLFFRVNELTSWGLSVRYITWILNSMPEKVLIRFFQTTTGCQALAYNAATSSQLLYEETHRLLVTPLLARVL